MTGVGSEGPWIAVFQMDIPIRWGDMDAMGHVNNTVYFRYLEQLRISWFDRIGCSPEPAGEGPIILNAWCSFLRELRYPGTVRAVLEVGPIGRSTFETRALMARTDDPGTICAEGGAKVVWIDFPRRKATPLSDSLKALIVRPVPGHEPGHEPGPTA
jgi:acyl-CoA thioester hydrolase